MSRGDVPILAEALSPAEIDAELARRAALYGAAPPEGAGETRDMLVWTIGAERYATPVIDVWATMAPVRLTAVPGAPAALIGVFARYGVIHNLFDPAAALGSRAGNGAGHMILILRHERPRIAIRVDAAIGIVKVSAESAGTIATDDGPVTPVDTEALIGRLIGPSAAREG